MYLLPSCLIVETRASEAEKVEDIEHAVLTNPYIQTSHYRDQLIRVIHKEKSWFFTKPNSVGHPSVIEFSSKGNSIYIERYLCEADAADCKTFAAEMTARWEKVNDNIHVIW